MPWIKFYLADHLTDPSLMFCSLATQGLWMRLIGLMTQSERYGVLVMAADR